MANEIPKLTSNTFNLTLLGPTVITSWELDEKGDPHLVSVAADVVMSFGTNDLTMVPVAGTIK